MGKARYQRGHSAQYNGFKLATSTFVLSILEYKNTNWLSYHCCGSLSWITKVSSQDCKCIFSSSLVVYFQSRCLSINICSCSNNSLKFETFWLLAKDSVCSKIKSCKVVRLRIKYNFCHGVQKTWDYVKFTSSLKKILNFTSLGYLKSSWNPLEKIWNLIRQS